MVIVGLVKKDIFAVFALNVWCVIFENAFRVDAVLSAELFPELGADYAKKELTLIAALANWDRDDLSGHLSV